MLYIIRASCCTDPSNVQELCIHRFAVFSISSFIKLKKAAFCTNSGRAVVLHRINFSPTAETPGAHWGWLTSDFLKVHTALFLLYTEIMIVIQVARINLKNSHLKIKIKNWDSLCKTIPSGYLSQEKTECNKLVSTCLLLIAKKMSRRAWWRTSSTAVLFSWGISVDDELLPWTPGRGAGCPTAPGICCNCEWQAPIIFYIC